MKNQLIRCLFVLFGLLVSVTLPAQTETVEIPQNIQEQQVGDFVAPLDESQVRTLLIQKLEKEAEQNATSISDQSVSFLELLKGINNPYTPLGGAMSLMIGSLSQFPNDFTSVINTLVDGKGWTGFWLAMGKLVLLIMLTIGIEWFALKRIRDSHQQRCDRLIAESGHSKLGYPLITLLINLIGLVIFTIVGYLISGFFIEQSSNEYSIIMRLFDAIVFVRFLSIFYRLLLHAPPQGLSLIDTAINTRKLFYCMLAFTFFMIVPFELFSLLQENGLSLEHFKLLSLATSLFVLNPTVLWFIWSERYAIDRILFDQQEEQINQDGSYRFNVRAMIWPTVVTVLLGLGYFNWAIHTLVDNYRGEFASTLAWVVIIMFPVVDLIVTSLLENLTSLPIFQSKRFLKRRQRFISVIRNVVRSVLVVVYAVSMLEAWGAGLLAKFSGPDGSGLIEPMIDIGVTILLGYILWEIIQLWIEKRLPEEPEEGLLDLDGEGGGAAASRGETLLPLLRTTLLITICIIVIITILYSLGIQIGPLLAGAGVVGIAVGFGSQKLVQDIISGVFFLIDDAFRKGEYVELAGLRGTIEKLSVRSMRLRHHLGAVQTIPYGEIQTVKNLSRDWVIMKLELRLPYDVDIEKVRKIIKKVGQEMMEDEEIGSNMLQPLKSQGVMRVEESALIIRMKFTAKPGEQWIVRRVAYTKVRDALAAAGIEFAHREVKVRLPEELEHLQKMDFERKLHIEPDENKTPSSTDTVSNTLTQTLTAAATSAVIASELAKQEKIDDADDGGDDR